MSGVTSDSSRNLYIMLAHLKGHVKIKMLHLEHFNVRKLLTLNILRDIMQVGRTNSVADLQWISPRSVYG
jgi:hypothetical protein